MPHHDDLGVMLNHLSIPEPRSNAAYTILEAAKKQKRRHFKLFDPLRRLRAVLYIPKVRTLVSASIFGFFILVGGVNSLLNPAEAPDAAVAPSQQQADAAPMSPVQITPHTLPDDLLLYDIELQELDPLANLWEA